MRIPFFGKVFFWLLWVCWSYVYARWLSSSPQAMYDFWHGAWVSFWIVFVLHLVEHLRGLNERRDALRFYDDH